jgi:hypothetical protein
VIIQTQLAESFCALAGIPAFLECLSGSESGAFECRPHPGFGLA